MDEPDYDYLFEKITKSTDEAEEYKVKVNEAYATRRQAVLKLREAGVSFGVIAKRLNIGRSAVQALVNNAKADLAKSP